MQEETQKDGIDFGDSTDDENLIGKYVDYTPVSGSFTSQGTYNGNGNQTFSTDENLKWRIFLTNSDVLTLISDTTANTEFYLGGYNGYNNGVLLLNNTCKALYSNSSLGAVGRSLNAEDIDQISSYDKTTYPGYGRVDSNAVYTYPQIFQSERILLGRSEQTDYIIGTSNSGGWSSTTYSYYTYTMSSEYMSSTYVFMFKVGNAAWLASRCNSDDPANFKMFYISNSSLDAFTLYIR